MIRFLVIVAVPIPLRRLAGAFQIRRVTVNQTILVKFMAAEKFMAAAMNQFNRVVAGEIRNGCRIQINADVMQRRRLALENGATAQVNAE